MKNLIFKRIGVSSRKWVELKQFSSLLLMVVMIGWPIWVDSHSYQLGGIRVTHPWAMPTALTGAEQTNSPGYLTLKNQGHKLDKLLSASADIATDVELSASIQDGGVVKRRQVDAFEIPAGKTVRLEPDGPHLMLIGLKKSLEEGQHFPVILQFEHAGTITVDMFVQPNTKESIY